MNRHILKSAEQYVTELFKKNYDETLVFHNLDHSENVVSRTKEIAEHYCLPDKEMFTLLIAAWFHDTGHLFTSPSKHESKSAELMKDFMTGVIEDETLISDIEQCILATKFPTHPNNFLEQIICDADTYHLSTDAFKETNEQVMKEERLKKGSLNKETFLKETLEMLNAHVYHTKYCQEKLNEGKMKNIQMILKDTI